MEERYAYLLKLREDAELTVDRLLEEDSLREGDIEDEQTSDECGSLHVSLRTDLEVFRIFPLILRLFFPSAVAI